MKIKRIMMGLASLVLFVSFFNGQNAKATTIASDATKIMWGKVEVNKGIVGKVTLLKDSSIYSIVNNKLKIVKKTKKGTELAVYGTKKYSGTYLYDLGNKTYVKKASDVKYFSIPEDILRAYNNSLKPKETSYLETLLPGIKFGMTPDEVTKVLRTNAASFEKDSMYGESYYIQHFNEISISSYSPIQKFVMNGETKLVNLNFNYSIQTKKLVDVYFTYNPPKPINNQKDLDKEASYFEKNFVQLIPKPYISLRKLNDSNRASEESQWSNDIESFGCYSMYTIPQNNSSYQWYGTNFEFRSNNIK